MTEPFLRELLGIRSNGFPNNADKDSVQSTEIARAMLDLLGVSDGVPMSGQQAGSALEHGVHDFLRQEMLRLSPDRRWTFGLGERIDGFAQYRHLSELDDLIKADESGTLSVSIGRDYGIKPDVTIGLVTHEAELPLLHASVSCKFTIRSDRVQNIRHEGVVLTRHRRGRQPHIVAVTTEPLPTRLASIARGTGEIDAVYHVALSALRNATETVGGPEQQHVLDELIGQRRLLALEDLPATLLH